MRETGAYLCINGQLGGLEISGRWIKYEILEVALKSISGIPQIFHSSVTHLHPLYYWIAMKDKSKEGLPYCYCH